MDTEYLFTVRTVAFLVCLTVAALGYSFFEYLTYRSHQKGG